MSNQSHSCYTHAILIHIILCIMEYYINKILGVGYIVYLLGVLFIQFALSDLFQFHLCVHTYKSSSRLILECQWWYIASISIGISCKYISLYGILVVTTGNLDLSFCFKCLIKPSNKVYKLKAVTIVSTAILPIIPLLVSIICLYLIYQLKSCQYW